MKTKVIPAGRPAGRKCYVFSNKKQREAWKLLTGQDSASEERLKALKAFGVDVEIDGEDSTPSPATTDAAQESN